LIGGQAVHFWTSRYLDRVVELRDNAPYTTKDLDFCGTADDARACAKQLGARCREFTLKDRSPCSAIVELGDLQIDFLRVPYGIADAQQLYDRSVRYAYGRVMHPMHVLESRVANVAGLPDHQTERGKKQLRGAILCMRELLFDTLDRAAVEPRAVRSALQLSERIFKLAESMSGIAVYVQHKLDVLDGVVIDERLPRAFLDQRLPQAQAKVLALRTQHERTLEPKPSAADLRSSAAQNNVSARKPRRSIR
jgi:hypothetical protein